MKFVSSGRCKESKEWREESQDEFRMHYQWLIVGSKFSLGTRDGDNCLNANLLPEQDGARR